MLDSNTLDQQFEDWEFRYASNTLDTEYIGNYFQSIAGKFMQLQNNPNLGFGEQLRSAQDTDPESQGFLTGNYQFDEQAARDVTIQLLKLFTCGPNYDDFLQSIKQSDTVLSVCGRVFKIGEPTYSCRECSMDPTCVLCSSCFKKSTHRNHKYKMATSSGGGCCDCGDTEAWKKDPFCKDHDVSNPISQRKEPLSDMVKKRCELVFSSTLNFCMHVLQMDVTGWNCPELEDEENTHCTILYNDETHTFEQVIQTLTSIVKCHHKTAIEYVTSIDREGRAVVKFASFEVCKKLKEDIENKATRSPLAGRALPLKVTVMHRNEVACQHLAMQILGWLQEFLTKHSTFRSIFAATITKPHAMYNLKHILNNDHNLWKSARSCWHRLLISGMLMEYDNKKILAQTFTKLYASLMQDFIRDDHYHSFSIVSLSVQLFTVPTIAHYLIEQESAFFKLMHTYFSESIEKHIKNRQLVFAKNTSTTNAFKRAAYILIDLKYLLSFKPEKWTQELRTGFVHGVQLLVKLLKHMQGMDAVVRQVGQHLEYEQEWETAFTLHLKLSHLITLVLEWCATDRIVLVKVYRMVLAALTEVKFIVHESEMVVCEVADHSASCLTYEVRSKPVSVHLPLTRFLAGLYTEIEKYGLAFDTIASSVVDRPTPEQIIEPVLCARTMMSQVHAGMWRRNGYTLVNQLFFYRNVKCRYEMLDRDIVILQIGASLIEANEFIIHVLNKYKLLHWLESEEFDKPALPADPGTYEEDLVRQTAVVVEEFLELLITIVGERYVPGVGDVTENDRIKKEIVQQLCIKPHSHSELSRALNEDNCSEITIESVIDDVAVFEKPNIAEKKGVYKLKPEYYSWFNLYFYHYSKEDKSKSEEAQWNRQKEKNELLCCPPPKLPKLTQSFSIIPNLLQCDVMLEIIRVSLTRALDLRSTFFTEGQLQRVLHLIGYAIQEEESENYPYLKFYEQSQKIGLLTLLEELAKSQRVESQRDLLRWVIQRYKAMEAKRQISNRTDNDKGESSGSSGMTMLEMERHEKEQRARLAATRRAQLLAQMQNAQKVFMTSNAKMFEEEGDKDAEAVGAEPAKDDVADDMEWQESCVQSQPVCLGPNRQAARPADYSSLRHTCILCSEQSSLATATNSCMVYAAFVQRSSVLSRYQQTDERGSLQFIETKTHPSPHITTCGHVMHVTCFDKYFNNEVIKEHRRPYRNRTPILFDIEKREFLCPLCRFLSNCLLPLVPPLEGIKTVDGLPVDAQIVKEFGFPFWYTFMADFTRCAKDEHERLRQQELSANFEEDDDTERIKDYGHLLTILTKLEESYPSVVLKYDDTVRDRYSKDLMFDEITKSSLFKFFQAVDAFTTVPQTAKVFSDYLATWLSCSYTIKSLEMLLRVMERPLGSELSIRYSSCLHGLVRVSCVLGLMLPSGLLQRYLMFYMVDLYETLFGNQPSSSFFEWDLFGILNTCLFITRSVLFTYVRIQRIPRGDELDHAIVQAVFLVNMLRTIITSSAGVGLLDTPADGATEQPSEPSPTGSKPCDEAEANLLQLYKKYNIHYQPEAKQGASTSAAHDRRLCKELVRDIRTQNHTLLRCCCLLFHSITDVELPKCTDCGREASDHDYQLMVNYLGLQADPLAYFKTGDASLEFTIRLAQCNVEQIERMRQMRQGQLLGGRALFQTAPPVRQLIELPDDYSDLINSVSQFTCPNNIRDDSRNPTMCLVCGDILCSQSFCCQKELDKSSVGSCTYHTDECGAGIGIFLRIRDAEILLLGINKGCFIAAPYLDEYGETDQGLRRGNPLRLCKERYRKLHITWLSHGLHEEITRRNETQQTLFATQWHNL
ncbi:E3 ubiquitin-protein ligase UBR1 [Anopheles nili]|uniref:E3 ubiquitin-protein ligase UBR1 n=1 Tax=Anopheles nili TaxID=185578 RepID=UPI00237A1164|nr:E3 ubiquitin-protein ligase UBR1 [Anopheles nili]